MPLFAILYIDFEGLHPSSCKVIAASSELAIAKNILEDPDRWCAVLLSAQPDDGDPRSIWRRIQTGMLTPETLLTLISRTSLDVDFGEMVRIYPLEIQSLNDVSFMRPGGEALSPAQDAGADSSGNLPNPLLPQLAEDARSLLETQDFQKYVEALLKQNIWQVSNLRKMMLISPDISTWLLPFLEIPIKLSNIQIGKNSGRNESEAGGCRYFHGTLQIGLWSSNLEVPIHPEELPDFGESRIDTLEDRWLDVGDSLRRFIEVYGFTISPQLIAEQRPKLLLELTCLIAYTIERLIPRKTTSGEAPSTR